jgi:hypothetical protein
VIAEEVSEIKANLTVLTHFVQGLSLGMQDTKATGSAKKAGR